MRPNEKKAYIESVKRRFSLNSHVNHDICRGCGKCCKRGGCGLMTCDVPELSVSGIKRMLDTGKYSIMFFCAYLDGEIIPVPIMKSREINSGRVNNSIISKPCALHTANGCPFSDDDRPTLGLLYVPKEDRHCKILVDSMQLLEDWYPHREMMEQVVLNETGENSYVLFYRGVIDAAMEIRQKLDMNKELTESEIGALQILEVTGAIAILGD